MRERLMEAQKRSSLKRKLFAYMVVLAAILVICMFMTLFLLGRFTDVKEQYHDTLEMQLATLENEVSDYYKSAAITAMQLSTQMTELMEQTLEQENLAFEALNNQQTLLVELQGAMFDPLKNGLLQANATGAFVIWDVTINSAVRNAHQNRNGLYIQLDSRSTEESTVIVYRGDSAQGKRHGAMPHRKWQLEFEVSDIPNFDVLMESAGLPLDTAHRLSPVFALSGTSEQALMLTVPIIGADGTVYGLCGLEIQQMYFKEKFSQPSSLRRLTCLLVPSADGHIDPGEALSCGVQNGYYYAPAEPLVTKDMGDGLNHFVGETYEYVGVTRKVTLAKGTDQSLLVAMVPKADYDRAMTRNNLEFGITVLLLAFFAVDTCLLFSYRFITLVTDGLRKLHDSAEADIANGSLPPQTGVREIDELIAFVTDKMRNRLPDVVMPPYMENMFSRFIEMTGSLTPSEMHALSLLIEGCDPKELHTQLYVSEGTAKQHVLKIYKKLGVSSRGELLLYIEMLKGCGLIDKIHRSE